MSGGRSAQAGSLGPAGAVGPADDFGGYVAARWPTLVRALVLLGCPEDRATEVAVDALARCQGGWSRRERESDVDAEVLDALVEAWDRWRREAPPDAFVANPGEAAPGGLPEPADLLAGLDALTPDRRAALVRGYASPAGAIDEPGPPVPGVPSPERLRLVADRIPVLAPPSAAEIGVQRRVLARRRTRRSLRAALAVAAPLLLVAGGVTWLVDRPSPGRTVAGPPEVLQPLPVTPAENPTNVVWEAGGVLHLDHGEIPLPPVIQLTAFGSGVLYADHQDRVVRLYDDGRRTVLGHEDPEVGFVSSDEHGWVAWVDPTGDRPEVVVRDVVSGHDVGRVGVDGSGDSEGARASGTVRPVAIDGDTVYLVDDQGVVGWQPEREPRPARVLEPAQLVAAMAQTRVYQSGSDELQVQPYFGIGLPVTGVGGRLSDDGRLLLTRTSGEAGGDGPVAVYDTTTGDAVQTGIAHDELAIDGVLGPNRTVTYLIARKADRPTAADSLRASFAGALQLRTCRLYLSPLVAPHCRLVTDIPVSGISPLLAH